SDQQHKTDRGEQHIERQVNLGDDLFEQWHDADGESAVRRIVLWVPLLHPARDHIHVRLRLRKRHARLQLGEDVEIFVPTLRTRFFTHWQWQQHVRPLYSVHGKHDLFGQRESGLHYSDDLEVGSAQNQCFTDHLWIATETSAPESVAQDHRRGLSRRVLFKQEDAAQRRFRAQKRKER